MRRLTPLYHTINPTPPLEQRIYGYRCEKCRVFGTSEKDFPHSIWCFRPSLEDDIKSLEIQVTLGTGGVHTLYFTDDLNVLDETLEDVLEEGLQEHYSQVVKDAKRCAD